MRKVRPDAKLKNLPPAKQAELFDILQRKTLDEAVAILSRKWKLRTGTRALSVFATWYPTTRKLEGAAAIAEQVKAALAADPKLSASQIEAAGRIVFEAQALEQNDARLFLGLRRDRSEKLAEEVRALRERCVQAEKKAAEIAILQRRCEELEATLQAERAAAAAKSAPTPEEVARKLDEALGRRPKAGSRESGVGSRAATADSRLPIAEKGAKS
jgi:hypothetical protein